MQSSQQQRLLRELEQQLAACEAELEGLRELRTVGPLGERELNRQRTLRAQRSDLAADLEDQRAAVERAIAFESSPEAAEQRQAALAALERVSEIAESLASVAAIEDQAGAAWTITMQRRIEVHRSLREVAAKAVRHLPGGNDAARERILSALSGMTTVGLAAPAVAWRLQRTLRGAECEGVISVGGLTFDPQAVYTVEDAVRTASSSLVRRLQQAYTDAGLIPAAEKETA